MNLSHLEHLETAAVDLQGAGKYGKGKKHRRPRRYVWKYSFKWGHKTYTWKYVWKW